jgi:hypothetical protein
MELELGLPHPPVPLWEVTLTVPLDQYRDRLVPDHPELPAGVIGAWWRERLEAGGELLAPDLETATRLATSALAQWLRLPGADLLVRPCRDAPDPLILGSGRPQRTVQQSYRRLTQVPFPNCSTRCLVLVAVFRAWSRSSARPVVRG